MLKLKQVTPPTIEPVTLGEIKAQLQIDPSDTIYDEQLEPLIPAAREWCETYQNRAYITQTWDMALDSLPPYHAGGQSLWVNPDEIKLPRPPLQSVTSITYTDTEGNSTVWPSTEYIADTFAEPGRVVPASRWPNTSLAPTNGFVSRYVAGYGDEPKNVPMTIRQAIILLVVHWFNNGLCDPPRAVYALLDLERVIPL